VSFQARDITGLDPKKYLFPSGFASTGRILYNGQNSVGKLSAVLVEGAFDVIATKIALDEDKEFRNVAVLGSFGMQLSGDTSGGGNDQLSRFLELKKSGLKFVTIMWDGETKAIMKAIKAGEMLKRIGLKVRIAILPKDRDPADIDPETLRRCFSRAKWLTQQYALQLKLKGDRIHLQNK
jgi:DNA primase